MSDLTVDKCNEIMVKVRKKDIIFYSCERKKIAYGYTIWINKKLKS